MTLLEYDDVIKKVTWPYYYSDIFWNILFSTTLVQSFITKAYLVQDISVPFRPPLRLFNVKKAQTG